MKNWMEGGGGACGAYGIKDRCMRDFGGETWGKYLIEDIPLCDNISILYIPVLHNNLH